jgi:hypothetical protein
MAAGATGRNVPLMTFPALITADGDLRRRIRPSREQLRVAAAIFAAACEDVTSVVVPVAVPDGGDDVGRAEQSLEYPGGYWLADRGRRDGIYGYPAAREAALSAARTHLRTHGQRGVPGWVSIRPDGSWAGFDGLTVANR